MKTKQNKTKKVTFSVRSIEPNKCCGGLRKNSDLYTENNNVTSRDKT